MSKPAAKRPSKKNDLEIVYNLQWKNKGANGGGDKANIVGMYDIPATTLNWDVFKSYLLKNSGIAEDDVKVSYVTSENREFPIESQTDFQIALYAFRRKAMMGEIINLKLELAGSSDSYRSAKPSTLSSGKYKSSDAETQFDCGVSEQASVACSSIQPDGPPEWFLNYMVQFKKDIIEETTAKVSTLLSNLKPPSVSQPSCYHSRKSKSELSKRRKYPSFHNDAASNDKESARASSKHDKWEEKQLEKLRSKAMKIVEKKLSVIASKSSDSDSGHQQRMAAKMDARPLTPQSVIPHMLGGEIYIHTWEVVNNGSIAWNHKTTLNFSWGSKELKPTETTIAVPHLKPNETGVISVRIVVPYEPGLYEGYWHFKHGGVRFGEWLGCQLIVDEFNLKGSKSVLETSLDLSFPPKKFKSLGLNDVNPTEVVKTYTIDEFSNIIRPSINVFEQETFRCAANEIPQNQNPFNLDLSLQNLPETKPDENETTIETDNATKDVLDNLVRDVSARIDDIKLQDPTDTNCSSDSDNLSVNSLSSNASSYRGEFVVVPTPECFNLESPTHILDQINKVKEAIKTEENFDDNNNNEESKDAASSSLPVKEKSEGEEEGAKSEMVMISLPDKKDEEEKGYAFIMVDGVAVPIPKKILKEEFLKHSEQSLLISAKKANEPEENVSSSSSSVEIVNMPPEESKEAIDEDMSHCSAAGSCYSSTSTENRRFIFPQICPGYEIVNSCRIEEEPHQTAPNLPSAPPTSECEPNQAYQHIPNYQQTAPNSRPAPVPEPTPVSNSNPPEIVNQGYEAYMGMPYVQENVQPVHILPETLVSGAVNVASSAINTARSVINMIKPKEPGRWVNGHWVSASVESTREANLRALGEMGFWDRDLNATLLARYNDDLNRVVSELVQ